MQWPAADLPCLVALFVPSGEDATVTGGPLGLYKTGLAKMHDLSISSNAVFLPPFGFHKPSLGPIQATKHAEVALWKSG
jgi:hypothetical protein